MGKRALCIGINYTGTDSALRGCINDVKNMASLLIARGFAVTTLTDDTEVKPTRENILRAIFELIMSGDKELFLSYSGHGSQVADFNGDETADKKDECLVPLDYQTNGMILDDHLRGLVSSLPPKCNLMILLDACHSGTCMDLSYNLWERNGSIQLIKEPYISGTDANVYMLSGSQDVQTSADTVEDGQNQGALTWGFLKVLNATKTSPTWKALVTELRTLLKNSGYDQVPNFSTGRLTSLSAKICF